MGHPAFVTEPEARPGTFILGYTHPSLGGLSLDLGVLTHTLSQGQERS